MGKACQAFVVIMCLISSKSWAVAPDSVLVATDSFTSSVLAETSVPEPKRLPPDTRVFQDSPLLLREYGFGILGSVVAGALSFYIGSGIESAIYGSDAHKGTLTFTGIRYDNQYGAFWGGATGILFGSGLTTYFIGETDEEDGGLFSTLFGTAVATGGAMAIASWMGVNDDIQWTPFIPLLAIPSVGGLVGFNVSRWFNDRKREHMVGHEASIHILPPRFGWIRGAKGGDRLQIQALNLGF